tara:strand:+ start:214 stop:519 length:306 start_codon:yes stop_codon:yes gene_type:complete
MDKIIFLHYVVILFIISIPFHPMKILKYTFITPLLIASLWLFFGDCPLTIIHGKNDKNEIFTQELYSKCIPNISLKTTENLNTFILVLVVSIVLIRFKNKC